MRFVLGPRQFQTKQAARKFVTAFVTNSDIGPIAEAEMVWLLPLLQRNPSYKECKHGYGIEKNKTYKQKEIIAYTNPNKTSWRSLSIKSCFNGKRNHREDKLSAFRQAITPQIRAFRQSSKEDKCPECNCELKDNAEVDHKLPFRELIKNFLEDEKLELENVNAFTKDGSMSLADTALSTRWVEYHGKNAVLRLLCKDCNSRWQKIPEEKKDQTPEKPL